MFKPLGLLVAAFLLAAGSAHAHHYERIEIQIDCSLSTDKENLFNHPRTLIQRYHFSLNTLIIDWSLLRIIADKAIYTPPVRTYHTIDFVPHGPTDKRPSEAFIEVANPLHQGASGFGMSLLPHRQIQFAVKDFLPPLKPGLASQPADQAALKNLALAFGENLVNPEAIVVGELYESNLAIPLAIGQHDFYSAALQIHYPEHLQNGLSYHFKINCHASLTDASD